MNPSPQAPAGTVKARPHALTFLVVVVMLDMMSLGLMLPVLPGLIKQLVHGDPSLAARYIGWIAALWATMGFLTAPLIGALSDRFGRRPLLLASMFGAAVDFAIMAWAPTIIWLFLGRALSGVTASSVVTAKAYIADVTPEDERAGRYGLLNAAFGVGLILGPLLGGLLGQLDLRLPFWIASGLCAVNGIFGLFVLPESLSKSDRKPVDLRRANPVGAFALFLNRPPLRVLAGVMFLYYISQQMLFSTAIPYIDYRYHWSQAMLGMASVLVGIGVVLVQAALVKPFVARFGERIAILVGLAGGVMGMLVYGFAPTGLFFLLGVPVYALVGLQVAAIQSSMTRYVEANEQGRLQGANASLVSITAMIAPPLFTEILARSIEVHAPAGTTFYAAAAILAVAFVLALTVKPRPADQEWTPLTIRNRA